MAITQNTYTGDGSTTTYSFTFPYLEETDIKVSLNGVVTTAYTLANATTVSFNTAPANGAAIRIYRDTNVDALAATFFAGSAIRAQDLNEDFLQSNYTVQEIKDRYLDKNTGGTITGNVTITGDTDITGDFDVTGDTTFTGTVDVTGNVGITGTLDMNNNRIINVATATAGTDAVNKNYVDAYIDTVYQGPLAADPATRTGGGALQEGDLYFNTVEDILKAWTGTEWVISAAAGNIVRWRKTAAGGETSLSGNDDSAQPLSYVVGNEQVFLNGALQQRGVDYTAATGTSINGLVALTAGDVVELHAVQGYVSATIADGSISDIKIAAAAGIQSSKLSFTQSGTGAVARTVDSKLKDVVSVKDFGAVGDGVTDDTAAIENAINNSHRKAVYFPRGIYKVTDTLNITVLSYSLVGERTERGQNTQFYRGGEYSAVRINFAPVDTTKFLVNMYQATTAINIIGPFEHKNLCFTLNGANGFQFGSEVLDIEDGPTPSGQAYVHGVRFENCNFETTGGSFGSDANGVITLTNRRHIGLAKCFESVVRDCSFNGGDYGIRTLGCDKFNVTGCRASAPRPLDFNGKNSFTVQHTVHDFQTEGWLISPIRNANVDLAVSNSRFEANVGSPTGYGRFVLPTCTATVTANSSTLTFSRSMDNILIPGWSVIELTDGTNTDICHVKAVSGTTVTVSTENFRFTWSGTATTVTRIHTFGPLHAEGSFGSTYTNISAGAGTNCPAFVYVGCRGSMYLTNCFAEAGAYGNIEVLAVGNRSGNAQFAMNGQMVLSSCTALLTPNVPSPLIRVINWNETNGGGDDGNTRGCGADTFDSLNKALRKWVYTPARFQTSGNNNQTIAFKKVSGDAGTNQSVYAWYLDGSNPGGRFLYFYDNSIPSATSGGLRILVRAKAVSVGTALNLVAGSNLGGNNFSTLDLSTDWKTYSVSLNIPSQWGSGGTSDRLLQLSSSSDVYVAAVAILDEDPAADGTYVSNNVSKALAHKQILLTSGSGAVIARSSGFPASFKIKAFGYNSDANNSYATVYGEFIVQTSNYGGTLAVRGVSTLFKQKHSVNAGVIDLDIAITAAVVSSQTEIKATATLTGAAGATTSLFRFEIEGINTTNITPS